MKISRIAASLLLSLAATGALAADPEVNLTLKDHRFDLTEIKVPAGQRVKITLRNLDSTPEEFHSDSLNREKVVTAGGTATIFIGPLKPGKYPFMGEFNAKTAQGVVIAE
jgi:hypothetical protein